MHGSHWIGGEPFADQPKHVDSKESAMRTFQNVLLSVVVALSLTLCESPLKPASAATTEQLSETTTRVAATYRTARRPRVMYRTRRPYYIYRPPFYYYYYVTPYGVYYYPYYPTPVYYYGVYSQPTPRPTPTPTQPFRGTR